MKLNKAINVLEQKQAVNVERQFIQKKFFYPKYFECDHSDKKHTQEFLRSSTCEIILKDFDNDVSQPKKDK